MTPFEWVDREGVCHVLETPDRIDEEVEFISCRIDDLVAGLQHADFDREGELRLMISSHADRLEQLRADAERWNAYASAQLREDAAKLVDEIEQLNRSVWPMTIIANLHDEHLELLRAEHPDELLGGEPTLAQREALAHSTIEVKPSPNAARGEVHEWLKGDPAFYRPMGDEDGWFEWLDADGVLRRLSSPLQIEYEIATLSNALWNQLPVLRGNSSQYDTLQAFETANSVRKRLLVLQADLERFSHEHDGRQEQEWKRFEMEWKKLRGSQ